jgi:NAD+ synthase
MTQQRISHSVLKIDPVAEAARIQSAIRDIVFNQLTRKGVVVGLSGGIDSSVVASLCARALGKDRVLALLMPEVESAPDSLHLGRVAADSLGIRWAVEEITAGLKAARCYERRDDAIRTLIPEYGDGYKCKVVVPMASMGTCPVFYIVVQSPFGEVKKVRLTAEVCLQIVAASNFKQRTRKMMEYYYADRLQYAVAGTPNLLEYDQGFFVKLGDGAADLKPIAHLYKSQVYELAAYLGIPDEIQRRPPTTDTYPLEQTQEEFYFSLPLTNVDLCLYGKKNAVPPKDLATLLGLTPQQVQRVYHHLEARQKSTQYLHMAALLVASPAPLATLAANLGEILK